MASSTTTTTSTHVSLALLLAIGAQLLSSAQPYILPPSQHNGLLPVFRGSRVPIPVAELAAVATTTGQPEATLSEAEALVAKSAEVEESRGHHMKKKHHHHMKKKRMMFPIIVGLFIAKAIIFPMLLKALTIMSSASFVLSKMSLLTSVLLGFKWFLTSQQQPQQQQPTILRVPDSPKVEVVHVPVKKYSDWDRENDHRPGSMSPQADTYDNYYSSDHEMKPTSYT